MTLLGWMHRKLRSNNDVFKEFNTTGGGACNCITGMASPDPDTFLASAAEYFADDAFDGNRASDLFSFGGGLLTIGTLGISAAMHGDGEADDEVYDIDVDVDTSDDEEEDNAVNVDGAATPTFTFTAPEATATATGEKAATGAVEAIAEKNDDTTTEDDLMLVSAELEKVLGGAGSDVPSARVSFAMGVDCPLQGFLFSSPVSDAESRSDHHKDGGGRRTSLGELFMRTRFADDKMALFAVAEDGGGAAGGGGDDGRAGKCGGGGGGDHKAMKKRKVKDDKGGGGGGVPAGATVTKSKFQKILQIFHRKVYPENTILARSLTKKNRKRDAPDNGGGGVTGETDEPLASPKIRCRKDQRMLGFGCCTNRAFTGSPGNGELIDNKSGHWIKTDADYLVLEL